MSHPYTYLVGWSNLDKWYYGVSYSNNCSPKDLWSIYFTSSKHVKRFMKENGNPDVIEVRRVFKDKQHAQEWETKVLRRLGVRTNDKWLNKNDCYAPPVMRGSEHPLFGVGHTEETKVKMKKKAIGRGKGVPKSEEHKRKIAEGKKRNWTTNQELKDKFASKMLGNEYGKLHKGWKPTEETKLRMSESARNRKYRFRSPVTEETKKKISESQKRRHAERIKKQGP